MNLNLTLFIQAGNFFIAYILFRAFLLKPAVALMQKQKQAQDLLRDKINHNQLGIEEKKQSYQQQWHNLQAYYARYKPQLVKSRDYVFKNISSPLGYPAVPDELVQQLTDQTADLLVKKLVE